MLPLLYLHGLSSGDFVPALGQFLGSSAGLSGPVITKLTETWKAEQRAFAARDLSHVDYVYLWADGIHVNIRLEEHKLCLLVLIGVRADGRKELVALADGYRESVESWSDLLRDAARRGMSAPVLAVGDGALGFCGEVGGDVDQVPQRAAQPVQPPHHERVARAQRLQHPIQLRALLANTGDVIGEHPPAPGRAQRVALQVCVGAARHPARLRDRHVLSAQIAALRMATGRGPSPRGRDRCVPARRAEGPGMGHRRRARTVDRGDDRAAGSAGDDRGRARRERGRDGTAGRLPSAASTSSASASVPRPAGPG